MPDGTSMKGSTHGGGSATAPKPATNIFGQPVDYDRNANVGKALASTFLNLFDVPVQAIGGTHRDVIQGAPTGGQSAGSRALQNYGEQVGGLWSDVFRPGAGQTPLFQPREFDAAGEAAVDRFGLSGAGAGAVRGGATALDLLTGIAAGGVGGAGRGAARGAAQTAVPVVRGANALRGTGMKGLPAYATAAGNPQAAASVLGKSAEEVISEGGPMQGALLRYLGRHRSEDPSLGKNLLSPRDVPVSNARDYGPGTYFGQTPEISDGYFQTFGDNVYKFGMKPSGWADTAKSKGYIDQSQLTSLDMNFPNAKTQWSDDLIQNLRAEGYLGFKHGGAFTDWNLGEAAGMRLKRTGLLDQGMGRARQGMSDAASAFAEKNPLGLSTAAQGLKEGKDSVLDALAEPFMRRNVYDATPSAIVRFAQQRNYPRWGGDGMTTPRPFTPNPQVAAFLKRLGVDKWWQDPALVQDNRVVRGAFYDPRIDEL
tara:strand:- start:43 stop:1488 length:1446 start_codon:yes stop_codon:yes gene_type:complete